MNKTKLMYILVLGFSLSITGCSLFESTEGESSESSSAATTGNADFDNMLAKVSARHKEVSKMGGAWTTPEDLLDQATEAAKNKEFDKAMKLLKEADTEVELAKAQFESQKNAGPHLF